MMKYHHITKTNQSIVQFNCYPGVKYPEAKTAAQSLQESYSGYQPTAFLSFLINRFNHLTRWFIRESEATSVNAVVNRITASSYTANVVSTVVRKNLRMNAKGIEIIKRFEGFPADVDPDVKEAEQIVHQLVTVPLTANQFSALVSFTYNVGEATLRHSALLKYLNAGRYRAAAKEFDRWVYIGSSRLPKLVARRVAERGLFLSTAS